MPEKQKTVDSPRKGTEAGTSEESELDTLLKEYEKNRAEPEGFAKVLRSLEPVIGFVNSERERRESEESKKFIDSTVDFMTEPDELKEVPKKWARGFLEAHYLEDADFQTAFKQRSEKPSDWSAALEKAREVFTKDLKTLAGNSTKDDVEAAKAAVQGTATEKVEVKGPSAASKAKMSDQEWGDYLAKTYPSFGA